LLPSRSKNKGVIDPGAFALKKSNPNKANPAGSYKAVISKSNQ
jgi:hypothetical protein